MRFLRSNIKKLENRLLRGLPHDIVLRFFELNKRKMFTYNCSDKEKAVKKFNNLMSKHKVTLNPFEKIGKEVRLRRPSILDGWLTLAIKVFLSKMFRLC